MDELIRRLEMYERADEFVRIGRLAVKEAQGESRRMGVANVYFINGRTYYELPNGEYSLTPPPSKNVCGQVEVASGYCTIGGGTAAPACCRCRCGP